jgi:DNA mismatch endonuclease (patch repair protein)
MFSAGVTLVVPKEFHSPYPCDLRDKLYTVDVFIHNYQGWGILIMVDVLTPAQRSFNMSQIRGRNTGPEIEVRSLLRSLGYRYRLHVKGLPGRPDIVIPRCKAIIFVHGCYWHMHRCRYGSVIPKTNAAFWKKKRMSNVERDKQQRKLLRKEWSVLTVWECETHDLETLSKKIDRFLKKLG